MGLPYLKATSDFGKPGTLKDVEMTKYVGLVRDFPCRFIKFLLQDTVDGDVSPVK